MTEDMSSKLVQESERGDEAADRSAFEKFDATFGLLPIAVRLADTEGRLVRVNEAFARMVGRSKEDLESSDYLSFTHPADMDATLDAIARLSTGSAAAWSFEKRRVLEGGDVQYVEIHLAPVRAQDGSMPYTIGAVLDITARRRAEEVNGRRDAVLRAIAAAAQALLLTRDTVGWLDSLGSELLRALEASSLIVIEDGRHNGSGARIALGLREHPGRIDERAWLDAAADPCLIPRADEGFRVVTASEADPATRAAIETLGGGSVLAMPFSVSGEPVGTVIVGRPDREREWEAPEIDALGIAALLVGNFYAFRAAERAISMRDRILEGIASLSSAMVSSVEELGDIAGILARLREVICLEGVGVVEQLDDRPQAVAWSLAPDVAPLSADRLAELCRSQGPLGGIVAKSGEAMLIPSTAGAQAISLLLLDHSSRTWSPAEIDAIRAAANLVDAQLRRARAEADVRLRDEQLMKAQKVEAAGVLAAGVAHDFSNALLVARAYAAGLAGSGDEEVRRAAQGILGSLDHSSALARRLHAFGRSRIAQPVPTDVNQAIQGARSLFARLVPRGVDLRLALEARPATVVIDPVHFEQVLMNLVINAVEAMPAGGRLEISTSTRTDSETEQHVVEISVEDSGVGMDAETLARALDPFFTTRGSEGHSGIGLATVDQIVKEAHGELSIRSRPGGGTSVRVALTAIRAGVTEEGSPDMNDHRPKTNFSFRPRRVLVVDDNPEIRASLERLLGGIGYDVVAAGSSAEAMSAIETAADAFDIVLTDIVMPGESGVDLAVRLSGNRGTPVIFMTGYAREDVIRRGLLDESHFVFSKDMPVDDLLHAIEHAIDLAAG